MIWIDIEGVPYLFKYTKMKSSTGGMGWLLYQYNKNDIFIVNKLYSIYKFTSNQDAAF